MVESIGENPYRVEVLLTYSNWLNLLESESALNEIDPQSVLV